MNYSTLFILFFLILHCGQYRCYYLLLEKEDRYKEWSSSYIKESCPIFVVADTGPEGYYVNNNNHK